MLILLLLLLVVLIVGGAAGGVVLLISNICLDHFSSHVHYHSLRSFYYRVELKFAQLNQFIC